MRTQSEANIGYAAEDEKPPVNDEAKLNSTIAMLLTESQKYRLVDALTTSREIWEGERLLIDLASRWNDSRLEPFLVSQLRLA